MILETREYFEKHYGYINLRDVSDEIIQEFLNKDYIKYLNFNQTMDCLCDYIVANDLTYI
jgi:hypothetical protein